MNALDWILLAILGLAAIRGYVRGLVKELLSVAAPAVGLASALFLYKWGGDLLEARFGLKTLPDVVAFLALFLIAFLLVKLLAKILGEGLEAANLATVDKILGVVLGLAEGMVIISVIVLILAVQPIFDTKALLKDSVFSQFLLPIVGPGVDKAIQSVMPAATEAGKEALKAVPPKK